MSMLSIKGLNKSFDKNHVLKDLDLEVPENTIYGFLGQNGAGKTTTMKIITGLLKADSGSVSVCGEEVEYGNYKTNKYIGYLPDIPAFYGYMNPKEYLKLSGEISGMSADRIKKRSEELLEIVGLTGVNRKISGFSRGMKQRLGFAHALLNKPRLLICDEPTSALDPMGRKEILDILNAIKGETTVIFSTHILSDVERICDHAAILHNGKNVLSGSMEEIRKKYRNEGFNIVFFKEEDMKKFLENGQVRNIWKNISADERRLFIESSDAESEGAHIMSLFAELHITPSLFEIKEPTLEKMFLEVTK